MIPWLSVLALSPLLAACQGAAAGVVTVADGMTITVFGRDIFDAVYSAASGKDCSIVRLDQSKTYCRPAEEALPPPQYCTRSLGDVDCWANPDALNSHPPPLADGPRTLTAQQQKNATRSWLGRWD